MVRHLPKFLVLALLLVTSVVVQAQCYDRNHKLGETAYQERQWNQAMKYFRAAQNCPDKPKQNDLAEQIKKCQRAIDEDRRQKEEQDRIRRERQQREEAERRRAQDEMYASRGYMEITDMRFANTDYNGNILTSYGAQLYSSDMRYLKPKIYYNGLASESKTITLYVKVINPDGSLRSGTSSPAGYSYSNSLTISSGSGNTLILSGWGNSDQSTYPVGTYRVEVWYNDNRLYSKSVQINKKYGETEGTIFGHDYVDLGLPSGTLWATCNVGASSPSDYGNYYAWGETSTKSDYSWSTYKYCYGSSDNLTKYCTSSSYGRVDNKTTLDLSDDAARANWGGSWRMPTQSEWQELRDNCTWTWTTQGGHNGYKVTSKKNGKSLFLPAAGYRDGSSLYLAGTRGYYWSSSLYSSGPYYAYYCRFYSGSVDPSDWNCRYGGPSVRPVASSLQK